MQTIAITGASGFIGRQLADRLAQTGEYEVRIFSRNRQRDLKEKIFPPSVEIVEGDLLNPASIDRLIRPGCTLINLAYLWHGSEAENLQATDNLIAACRNKSVGRLIHCSTAVVVGRAPGNWITEETPCKPVTEYGITKLKIENAVAMASAKKYFDLAIIRPTAVFGLEGEQLKKLVSDLKQDNLWVNYVKSCLYGERRMNLVHVANVIAAIVFLVRYPNPIGGEVFIVSDDDNPNNNFAYVEQVLKGALGIGNYPLLKMTLPPWMLSALLAVRGRNNINPLCNYDPSKLLGLGYERPMTLEKGLAEYAARYRSGHHSSGGAAV